MLEDIEKCKKNYLDDFLVCHFRAFAHMIRCTRENCVDPICNAVDDQVAGKEWCSDPEGARENGWIENGDNS